MQGCIRRCRTTSGLRAYGGALRKGESNGKRREHERRTGPTHGLGASWGCILARCHLN